MPTLTKKKIGWVQVLKETKNKTRMGWGACDKCSCSGFKEPYGPDKELCDNCGHSWGHHWE
jgi:hypothetical protein